MDILLWYSFGVLSGVIIYIFLWLISKRSPNVSLGDEQLYFNNKIVWITGASSGIGRALAIRLHYSGARLILSGRNKDKLERLLKTMPISKDKSPHIIQVLDLSNLESIPNIVNNIFDKVGNVDIMVHNAGVSMRALAVSTKFEVDQLIMNTNYFGAVLLTKLLLPSMIEKRNGQFCVISSLQGKFGVPGRTSYSASKHALQGYFDALSLEIESYNIKVNIISPGYVNTSLSLNALTENGESHGQMDETTKAGFSVDYVVQEIVNGLLDNNKDVIVASTAHKVGVLLKTVFPTALDAILRKRFKRQI